MRSILDDPYSASDGRSSDRGEGLRKRFGDVTRSTASTSCAPAGTILGLLGPNGAGKTTAVRILTTLLPPDAARRAWRGSTSSRTRPQLRARIGLAGQYAAVDENLTGFENLEMVGRLYHLGRGPVARARARAARALLAHRRGDRQAKTYSGGMRRRLDLAAALVARPPVLFLDEPTTGLDPVSRLAAVGDDRGARGGRHHGAAHHAVPGRGRPARRPHRRDRPRPGDRRGHLGRAEGPRRRRAARADARRTTTRRPLRSRRSRRSPTSGRSASTGSS